jgi:PTH1 family peptidyl-tRNA hydrolase
VKRARRLPLKKPSLAKKRKKQRSSRAQVVVGLRNPGAEYEGTRHNLGYEVVVEVLARRETTLTRGPSRVGAMMASSGPGAHRTLYVVSNGYMNESGRAVRAALVYYKVDPADMLVVHDDIDLAFGRLRLQVGGGSGGHNGVRSVEKALGSTSFSRLKLGVGRPPGSQDPADYVLSRFTRRERPGADVMVQDAADVVETWLEDRTRAQEVAALRGRDDGNAPDA